MSGAGTWGYLAARPDMVGAAASGCEVLNLDADTLEAAGARQYPASEIRFKFGGSGLGRTQALLDILNWMAAGTGSRKELVLVAQLSGLAHAESDKQGVPTGRTVQNIGGFYLLEVPRVSGKAPGKVGALPLSGSKTRLPARGVVVAAQAAASAHQAKATVANAADALAGIAADVDSL